MFKKDKLFSDLDLVRIYESDNEDVTVIEVGIRRVSEGNGSSIKIFIPREVFTDHEEMSTCQGGQEKIKVRVEVSSGCWSEGKCDLKRLAVMSLVGYMYLPSRQFERILFDRETCPAVERDDAPLNVDLVKDYWLGQNRANSLNELAYRLAQALYQECYVGIGPTYFDRSLFDAIRDYCSSPIDSQKLFY